MGAGEMKLYKLTDSNGKTRNHTQWGAGVTHTATGSPDQDLCSSGWIHAYEHPVLAVIMNPIHADFKDPQLWECEGEVGKRDGQIKVGCRSLTTMKQISVPVFTTEQIVRFAITCAKRVYHAPDFSVWAENWLSGKDRTKEAAARAEARAAARAVMNKRINLVAIIEELEMS